MPCQGSPSVPCLGFMPVQQAGSASDVAADMTELARFVCSWGPPPCSQPAPSHAGDYQSPPGTPAQQRYPRPEQQPDASCGLVKGPAQGLFEELQQEATERSVALCGTAAAACLEAAGRADTLALLQQPGHAMVLSTGGPAQGHDCSLFEARQQFMLVSTS